MLSNRLKHLRIERELTQDDVAAIIKVSRVVYNRYENNQRTIPFELICELADFYDVSLDYLAGRKEY